MAQRGTRHPADPPQPFYAKDWADAQASLVRLRRGLTALPTSPLRILRVSQLDADVLDMELFSMLKDQIWQALSLFKASYLTFNVKEWLEPEITALLGLVIYKLSVYDSGATYGAQLQNLKFRNERRHRGPLSGGKDAPLAFWQKFSYALLTIGGQYVWTRVNRLMTDQGWGDEEEETTKKRIWTAMQRGERLFRAVSLVNFLFFLWSGKYRTIIERFLSMRMVYQVRSMNRQVSFEFLNRQLVWHAFTEFLMFIVPLVNIEKLKLRAQRMILPESYLASQAKAQGFAALPETTCAICYQEDTGDAVGNTGGIGMATQTTSNMVTNPHVTNCGHKYCYWCIKTKLVVYEGEWACLRCGERIKEIQPVSDKVEEPEGLGQEGDGDDGEDEREKVDNGEEKNGL
ncbi:hypothetical protein BZG36_01414 [Bifiguratus adelaidae]|uniref:RING-type E3 ubiquitin transferase (cysteine targeting) n=1 Tax=Bifiguratus adelaidae TaxID=1938954 RepID=A0A261Y552_9FUNG|nr:hypothetical protein BZG36_01414 [Bifiguratus adelaidae]